jgi:hypothetical protein
MKLTPKVQSPDQARIVAFLARDSEVPIDEVARLYENERAKLETGAHIKGFLSIFAIRNVQEILFRRRAEAPPRPTLSAAPFS